MAGGDRSFQIHQPQLRLELLHPGQAFAPGCFGAEGRWDRAVALLGELNDVRGITRHRLLQAWPAVAGHQLIDAASEHQIAAQ